ncbi:hypothetical protein HDU98_009060 [Podochytrium sp. JEL0797]|nr:hypothetical protein HDU98_009060 [Podochytrium sp. JEL0797]
MAKSKPPADFQDKLLAFLEASPEDQKPNDALTLSIASTLASQYTLFLNPPRQHALLASVSHPAGLHFGRMHIKSLPGRMRVDVSNSDPTRTVWLNKVVCMPPSQRGEITLSLTDPTGRVATLPYRINSRERVVVEVSAKPREDSDAGVMLAWLVMEFRVDATPPHIQRFAIVRSMVMIVDPSLVNQQMKMMDVFAKPFVPDWVKVINAAPARKFPGIPPPSPNLIEYVQSWIAPDLVVPNTPVTKNKKNRPVALSQTALSLVHLPNAFQIPDPKSLPAPTPLSPTSYSWRFMREIGLEVAKRNAEMEGYTLFGVNIGGNRKMWELIVPGIVEDSPRIRIGDLIRIRRLNLFDGIEYDAYVFSEFFQFCILRAFLLKLSLSPDIVRRKATLYFHLPHLPNFDPATEMFNVQFTFTETLSRFSTRALLGLEKFAATPTGRKQLFPEPEDAILRLGTDVKAGRLRLEFFDGQLNWAQQKAVSAIVENDYGEVPFLIWGPPGTGKTKTVIESIHQLLENSSNCTPRILACAPSHSACDTLTRRLLKFMTPSQLFRFNPATRPFNEVPDVIMPFTVTDPTNAFFGIPNMQAFLKLKVVVCTTEDAGILGQCGFSNTFMNESYARHWERMKTQFPFYCHGVDEGTRDLFWTHLFIDEAGQATEPESLIPISLVACQPLVSKVGVKRAQIVLCGDHMQLGPIVHSEEARIRGLNISLFERLIRRPLYRNHPESRCMPRQLHSETETREEPAQPGVAESLVLSDCVPPFANLVRNYRSHPSFLMIPSLLSYDNTLIPSAAESLTHSFVGSEFLPNPDIPILFHGIQGEDSRSLTAEGLNNETEASSAAWYNAAEAGKIVELVIKLMQEEGVKTEDFGVISPFRQQVKLIRELLRNRNLAAVDVGTVEDYQGMERRIILISTVRSRSKHLYQDLRNDLGLVHFAARLNVALTRAQALLVVVGNPLLLSVDPQWVACLAFWLRNGCYRGCAPPVEVDEAAQSGDGVEGNYGGLEKARDVAKQMMEAPVAQWLGAATMDTQRGDVEEALAWSLEYLEQIAL